MGIAEDALGALNSVAARSSSVTVAYSDGKDSRVVMDLCVRSFSSVDAFFMYLVPGLECQEVALAEAERRWGVRIRQYPHWIAAKALRNGVYCHERIRNDDLPELKMRDVYALALKDSGASHVITGAKAADSGWRRRFMNSAHQESVVNPIKSWHKYDVLSYLRARNIQVPPSSGKSATGIDLSTPSLLWLSDTFPDDFRRVCEVFPFAEAVVWRREFYG